MTYPTDISHAGVNLDPSNETKIKYEPDTIAYITWGTSRRGGRVLAIRHYGHNGWIFPAHATESQFVYDEHVTKVEVMAIAPACVHNQRSRG